MNKGMPAEARAIFENKYYAHRGLHTEDKTVPENSLAAFRRAVEHGYGVELDVQLSKDGQVMVFHDDNLKRMCGVDGNIWDYTFDELRMFRLLDTNEKIPLFTEVIEVLNQGTGALICELKTGPRNNELCEKTLALLKTLTIPYCIESFNPFVVRWFYKNAPEIIRGQLATSTDNYKSYPPILRRRLAACGLSYLNKPHFIAYDLRPAEFPKGVQKQVKNGVLLVGWTSLHPEDVNRVKTLIFQFYEP